MSRRLSEQGDINGRCFEDYTCECDSGFELKPTARDSEICHACENEQDCPFTTSAQTLFFFLPQLLHDFLRHFFQKESRGSLWALFFFLVCFFFQKKKDKQRDAGDPVGRDTDQRTKVFEFVKVNLATLKVSNKQDETTNNHHNSN